jgi:hypothetical protein
LVFHIQEETQAKGVGEQTVKGRYFGLKETRKEGNG